MKTYVLLCLILFLSAVSTYSFEEITTINDKTLCGYVIYEDPQRIEIIDENSVKINVPKSEIKMQRKMYFDVYTKTDAVYKVSLVTLGENEFIFADKKGLTYTVSRDVFDYLVINDKKLNRFNWLPLTEIPEKEIYQSDYFSTGITIGTPGMLNAVLMYDFEAGFGLKGSAGPKGYEFSLLLPLINSKSFDSHLFAGGGYMDLSYGNRQHTWKYFGLGIDANYYGFYAELGISFGEGTGQFKNGQILGGIGYVYRWN